MRIRPYLASVGALLALHSAAYAAASQAPVQKKNMMQKGYVTKLVPEIPILADDTLKLDPKQQKSMSLVDQWKNRCTMPFLGDDGSVQFVYGASYPAIVCAPLYACDVSLQAGEVIRQVMLGDSSRWKVSPGTSGNGESTVAHLVIKPADVGLSTNLVIYTDRRNYNIRLVSKKDQWMPLVSFSYPDDNMAQWASYRAQQEPQLKAKVTESATLPPPAAPELNFNYRIKGDATHWKPIRVYSDSSKTYIQFPPSVKNDQVPALVVLDSSNQEQMVNYRMVDDRYVVDLVIEKAALIRGVGRHQERVEIAREGTQS